MAKDIKKAFEKYNLCSHTFQFIVPKLSLVEQFLGSSMLLLAIYSVYSQNCENKTFTVY